MTNTKDFEPFKVDGEFVEKSIVTEFNIKKRRVPGNIWKNNQIYKFEPSNEPDGMVILKLKPSSDAATTVSPTKVVPAADTTADAAVDTSPDAAAAATTDAPAAEGRPSLARRQVKKMKNGFGKFISSLTGRKPKPETIGGKRKKKTKRKRKNRKKNSKKRTKRKK
jgi:hypothetical protein